MKKTCLFALLAGALFSTAALAQVAVTDAWARATVPQQKSAGAFMRLRSQAPAKLVAASTPAAARAEVHEMKMQGQTMTMHEVDAIELPAGKEVVLGPGGYHVMLFGLKQQLKEGDSVPLTLVVEDAAGKRVDVKTSAQVKPIAYQPPAK
jgi:periplasmic copper chaperone A